MKKTLIVLSLLLACTGMRGQTLYTHLQHFTDACLQEEAAIRVENPDYNTQLEQLQATLKAFMKIPMRDGSRALHPSQSCSEASLDGHILFLPTYVAGYIENKIPDAFSTDVPYVDNETTRSRPGEVDSISIYYTNVVLCPNGTETFSYRVSAGEQQLIVLAEDDTPLAVSVSSEAGTNLASSTDAPQGVAKQVWRESAASRVTVRVSNPTDKHVSFVIAVH